MSLEMASWLRKDAQTWKLDMFLDQASANEARIGP